jgi:putative GTP pyrophosphokinase
MIDQKTFLSKFKIDPKKFEDSKLSWTVLQEIHKSFTDQKQQFEATGTYVSNRLAQVPKVHSTRLRIKNAEHLLEKIIRKALAKNDQSIDASNYAERVTDLIGIRALHLFKEDWLPIHEQISTIWELKETPVANVRKGDPQPLLDHFAEKGCKIHEHEFGYRSIHYLVISKPAKQQHLVEIQLRTIFEEGWSEIDHKIRYPYDIANPVLSQFLVVFNRLAGSADEMGSFVVLLQGELQKRQAEAATALDEKNAMIDKLQSQIKQLKIEHKDKERLRTGLDELSKSFTGDIAKLSLPVSSSLLGTSQLSGLLGHVDLSSLNRLLYGSVASPPLYSVTGTVPDPSAGKKKGKE